MLGMGLINDGSWIMFFLPSAARKKKKKRGLTTPQTGFNQE